MIDVERAREVIAELSDAVDTYVYDGYLLRGLKLLREGVDELEAARARIAELEELSADLMGELTTNEMAILRSQLAEWEALREDVRTVVESPQYGRDKTVDNAARRINDFLDSKKDGEL